MRLTISDNMRCLHTRVSVSVNDNGVKRHQLSACHAPSSSEEATGTVITSTVNQSLTNSRPNTSRSMEEPDPDRLSLGGDEFLYCSDSVADYLRLPKTNHQTVCPSAVNRTDYICAPPDCCRFIPMSLHHQLTTSRDRTPVDHLAPSVPPPTFVDYYDIAVQTEGHGRVPACRRTRRLYVPASWTSSRCCTCTVPRSTASQSACRLTAERSFAVYNMSVWPLSDRGLRVQPPCGVRAGWVTHRHRYCSEHGHLDDSLACSAMSVNGGRVSRWKLQLTDSEWLRVLRSTPDDPIFRRIGLRPYAISEEHTAAVLPAVHAVPDCSVEQLVTASPGRRRVHSSPSIHRNGREHKAVDVRSKLSRGSEQLAGSRALTAARVQSDTARRLNSIAQCTELLRDDDNWTRSRDEIQPPCNSPASPSNVEDDDDKYVVSDDVRQQLQRPMPPSWRDGVFVEGSKMRTAARGNRCSVTPRSTARSIVVDSLTSADVEQSTSVDNLIVKAVPVYSRVTSLPVNGSTDVAYSRSETQPRSGSVPGLTANLRRAMRKYDVNNNKPAAPSVDELRQPLHISVIVPC